MKPELDLTLAAPGTDPARTATLPGRGTPPAAGAGLASGQQLGHFRIERALGAGGMGEVYLATDLALDRPVAIKVLPAELAADPGRRDRLIREARSQARVTHANVAHIYFVGEEAGRLFFAMEYIAGETLAARIAQHPLSADAALEVIRAAALGLREAQRNGITHRDIKPSNLMLDGHGVLKVLDFGLSAGAPGEAADGPVAQTSLGGTPLYMAPEQARGEAIDCRADIYSLGATLYHLVASRPPFHAETAGELLTLHATAARPSLPRRGQLRTQIGALDSLCAKMMAARPEDRFESYDELLRAIELASSAHTRPAGFWARSIATIVDFLLVTLVVSLAIRVIPPALGWAPVEDKALTLLGLGIYQALAVARWGRTLGKSLFELEVADVETSRRPRLARATRRAFAIVGFPLILTTASGVLEMVGHDRAATIVEGLAVTAIPIGLGLLLHASLRVTSKRAAWDRAGSTIVRYRR